MKIKVLITGMAGFIGSNLARDFLKKDRYSITGIDCFDSFYDNNIKRKNIENLRELGAFEFIEGDILNKDDLNKAETPDVIIHLAARPGVRQSIKFPKDYIDVNIAGTQNLLDFARERRVKQFVFASSSSVYGINESLPWKEDCKILPISPYASSKASSEMLGHVYSHLYGIRFVALRLFTVYGPSQRPDLLINKIYNSIDNNLPITIYGDGSASRDFTNIIDVTRAIACAVHFEAAGFNVFNVGTGRSTSLLELIGLIEGITQSKGILNFETGFSGDICHTLANTTKSKSILGYEPTIGLKDGLESYYSWRRDRETVERF